MRFTKYVTICLSLVGLVSSAFPGGNLQNLDVDGNIINITWPDAMLPIPYMVNELGASVSLAGSADFAVTEAAVDASYAAWQDVGTARITWENIAPGVGTTNANLALDGDNIHRWVDLGAGGPLAFAPSFILLTETTFDTPPDFDGDGDEDYVAGTFSAGTILDSDVTYNSGLVWNDLAGGTNSPAFDIQDVSTHEIGHSEGLSHTLVRDATMFPFIGSDVDAGRTLNADDIAYISYYYPSDTFDATFGKLEGIVTSGVDGHAVLGASVFAVPLADFPAVTDPISAAAVGNAVSGFSAPDGSYFIPGLVDGDYFVCVEPLDGSPVSPGQISAIVAGTSDTDFPEECYDSAESGDEGFPGTGADAVSVSAGTATSGIDIITNTFPGRVDIRLFGDTENIVTFTSDAFLVQRIPTDFKRDYVLESVSIPTFTFSGTPAEFPSLRVVGAHPDGSPDMGNVLHEVAPFIGSPNGVTTVDIGLERPDRDPVFYIMLEFPSAADPSFFPFGGFPFIRMDFTFLEEGWFGSSYFTSDNGPAPTFFLSGTRNYGMMATVSTSVKHVPHEAPRFLGANAIRFNGRRANYRLGFAEPSGQADNLIERFKVRDTNVYERRGFADVQVETFGELQDPVLTKNRVGETHLYFVRTNTIRSTSSLPSNMVLVAAPGDALEANGEMRRASAVDVPFAAEGLTIDAAGDQDYFKFSASAGDIVEIDIDASTLDPASGMDPFLSIFDSEGNFLAFNDDFDGLDSFLAFEAPADGDYFALVEDFSTSFVGDLFGGFAPQGPPFVNAFYNVTFGAPSASAASVAPKLTLSNSATTLLPDEFALAQNYPNPFNPETKINYQLPEESRVVIKIFNVTGQAVRLLVNDFEPAGFYEITWDGRNQAGISVPSGTYFYQIQAGSFHQVQKMTLLK